MYVCDGVFRLELARQVSARSGRALVELKDNRIEITGTAVLFMEGKMSVP